MRNLKEKCGPPVGPHQCRTNYRRGLPHMVPVVAVVPAVHGPAVGAPPVLPPARVGRRRYKARQHCEGSEKYGKPLDIESHGFSLLLIGRTGADLRPREQDARELRGFRRRIEAEQRRSALALRDAALCGGLTGGGSQAKGGSAPPFYFDLSTSSSACEGLGRGPTLILSALPLSTCRSEVPYRPLMPALFQ